MDGHTIQTVGIIGAGTMGAGIAAHLANADLNVILLDRVTPNLSPDEQGDPQRRNALVASLFERLKNARPPQLGHPNRAGNIRIGNTEDDFDLLATCDWVIEVIAENLTLKRDLMARLEAVCHAQTVISSNTSGIPIAAIAEGRSAEFRARFLGTHFFNPPRYLKLVELIPTADTDPELLTAFDAFVCNRLGKGTVIAKDSPNFIANRFGSVTDSYNMERALAAGFTVAETDALTGALLFRPKTATFRLADLVGLDVMQSVRNNLYDAIPHDPYRDILKGQHTIPLRSAMIERGWLGNKAKQGFSKKVMVNGKRAFWTLNLQTLDYEPPQPANLSAVDALLQIRNPAERLQAIMAHDDPHVGYARDVLLFMLCYAAHIAPKCANSLRDIDCAVRWGFNHRFGPFQIWDMLGVEATIARMETLGLGVPTWVTEMAQPTFYSDGQPYDWERGDFRPISADPKHLTAAHIRQSNQPLASNASATLHDSGDGVLLLEFHSKANAIDSNILELTETALDILNNDFDALVIGNDGRHFSVGARLGKGTTPEQADARTRRGQTVMMKLQSSSKPVVTAVQGMALGGGAEFSMHSWATVAHHESRIGLVEFNVGLTPAWGGCKEMVRRLVHPDANPEQALRKLFRQLMQAQISMSAWDSKALGFLRDSDLVVMQNDHLLHTARAKALALTGQPAPIFGQLYATGAQGIAWLQDELAHHQWGRSLSDFDQQIGRNLAYVLAGGEIAEPAWVDAWHFLDLERQSIGELRQDERSKARTAYMLKTGKPLRN